MPAEGDYTNTAIPNRDGFSFLFKTCEVFMRTIIFANGDAPDERVVKPWLDDAALTIAADGGARNALSIGVMPQIVIGDLDSLQPADRLQLEQAQAQFIVYPTRKDYTDLELAIRCALERGATEIIIVSALGGRWDQSLANMLLLTLPELKNVPTRIIDQHESISVIRNRAEIAGHAGDTLSLIALRGDARGVSIEGCEYPLKDAVLPFGATLGISNVFIAPAATVTVNDGIILAIHTTRDE